MIYGKIWLVVKPSVGIPVFLGAVAVGSFAVHLALLTHTTWLPAYLNGGMATKAAAVEATVNQAAAPPPAAGAVLAAAAQQRP